MSEHPPYVTVPIIAHIRKNETGEVRKYEDDCIVNEGDIIPDDWVWTEGNSSCDCNRVLYFERAAGGEGDWDLDCSDDKYSVNLELKSTGEIFYREYE